MCLKHRLGNRPCFNGYPLFETCCLLSKNLLQIAQCIHQAKSCKYFCCYFSFGFGSLVSISDQRVQSAFCSVRGHIFLLLSLWHYINSQATCQVTSLIQMKINLATITKKKKLGFRHPLNAKSCDRHMQLKVGRRGGRFISMADWNMPAEAISQ